jgi:hypothetical protein
MPVAETDFKNSLKKGFVRKRVFCRLEIAFIQHLLQKEV